MRYLNSISRRAVPYLPRSLRERVLPAEKRWSLSDEKRVAVAPNTNERGNLLIAPTNSAGQGRNWAEAVRSNSDFGAVSLQQIRATTVSHSQNADVTVPLGAIKNSYRWSKLQSKAIRAGFSHVVIESASPILGVDFGGDVGAEIAEMKSAGIKVALLWHGSDIRKPGRHAEAFANSPFQGDLGGLTDRLEAQAKRNAELADEVGLPEFVSTPDLLTYRPDAIWLPVLVDQELWRPRDERTRDGRFVVVHAPSNPKLKGTDVIRRIMGRMQDEGIIEYREVSGRAPHEVPHAVADADLVIDQINMGLYSTVAVEAMSLGRPVIAEVGSAARERIQEQTGFQVPIVEANADSLDTVVRELIGNSRRRRDLMVAGQDYVRGVHSPANVANILTKNFLL